MKDKKLHEDLENVFHPLVSPVGISNRKMNKKI
jgi:hypothetical protein